MKTYRVLIVFGVLTAMTAAASAGPVIGTSGLIGYYGCDNSNNVLQESTGNGADGTITSDSSGLGPAYVASFAGRNGVLEFQGRSAANGCHGYGLLPAYNTALLNFSVAYWIYNVDAGGQGANAWITTGYDTTYGNGNIFRTSIRDCDNSYSGVNADTYEFTMYDVSNRTIFKNKQQTDASYWTDDPNQDKGKWTQVTYTYDGNASDPNYGCCVYVNGTLSMHHAAALANPICPWTGGMYLGATSSGLASTYNFDGYLDDLYLYSRTLSAGEAATLASTPEPSSIILVIAAGLSALAYGWRKRYTIRTNCQPTAPPTRLAAPLAGHRVGNPCFQGFRLVNGYREMMAGHLSLPQK